MPPVVPGLWSLVFGPSAFLAEFTPLSPQAQLAVVSLLGLALLVLAIRSHVRRQPPLDSELVKLSMAIDGLQTTLAELKAAVAAHASHGTEIEALQEKVRMLEQHREEDQKSNRTYTRESGERIFKKIDDLADTMNANFQSIENRLGRVDGAIEMISQRITRAPFDR